MPASSSSEPPEEPAGGRRVLATVFALFVLGATAVGGTAWAIWRQTFEPGPLPASRNIVVPRGTPGQIGDTLAREGLITDPRLFLVVAEITRGEGPLHAAEFAFPDHATLREVLTILRTAKPVAHKLTIPEGLTAAQIAALLDRADAATGPTPPLLEGEILPETYTYESGASRDSLVARARSLMNKTLTQVWAGRAEQLPLASATDLLTLASIVERETSKPDERPHIAAVFLNRLRLGMRLQSDPTVIYAATNGGGGFDRPITRADLDRDSPYNTYRVTGLPPGPINSPGLAALQAVAHPAVSDDLYFVADGTGGHAFARTNEEHQRNVARWRALGVPSAPTIPLTPPPAPTPASRPRG